MANQEVKAGSQSVEVEVVNDMTPSTHYAYHQIRPSTYEPLSRSGMNYRLRALSTISVALGAYLGVALRVVLAQFSKLPWRQLGTVNETAVVPPDEELLLPNLGTGFFLPNIVGSFLFGTLAVASVPHHFWPVVKTGISTGLCGSCTTFATWQLVVSLHVLRGHLFTAVLQSGITVATSYVAFLIGRQLSHRVHVTDWERIHAQTKQRIGRRQRQQNNNDVSSNDADGEDVVQEALTNGELGNAVEQKELIFQSATDQTITSPTRHRDSYVKSLPPVTEEKEYVPPALFLCGVSVVWLLAAISLLVAAILLPTMSFWQKLAVATFFGPVGAVGRYWLSIRNPRHPKFPAYTFIANIAASTVNIVIFVIGASLKSNSADSTSLNWYTVWIQTGISTGGMGSLSTVSTWISELYTLSHKEEHLRHAYGYGVASVAVAQAVCLTVGGLYIAASGRSI